MFVASASVPALILQFLVLCVSPMIVLGSSDLDIGDRIFMISSIAVQSVVLIASVVSTWKKTASETRTLWKEGQKARLIAEEISIWAAATDSLPASRADKGGVERDHEAGGGDAMWMPEPSSDEPRSGKQSDLVAKAATSVCVVLLSALLSWANVGQSFPGRFSMPSIMPS